MTSSYFGNEVTMTDQQGKQRKSVADALGRPSTVYEPDGYGSLSVATSYSYDLLNNLTQVTQGAQTRRFRYDQLSRLLDSASVEEAQTILDAGQNWSAKFTYDANSNVLTKQDARGVTTTLAYDELNRVTSKTYSDTTPAASYFYDASQPASIPVGFSRGFSVGKLTAATTSTTGTYYGYDALGRTNQSYQRLDGTDYAFSNYSYNKASLVTSETFPSERVVSNSYDAAGRISAIASGGIDYASAISYAAAGARNTVAISGPVLAGDHARSYSASALARTTLSMRSPSVERTAVIAGWRASIRLARCPGASPPAMAALTAPHRSWPSTITNRTPRCSTAYSMLASTWRSEA